MWYELFCYELMIIAMHLAARKEAPKFLALKFLVCNLFKNSMKIQILNVLSNHVKLSHLLTFSFSLISHF